MFKKVMDKLGIKRQEGGPAKADTAERDFSAHYLHQLIADPHVFGVCGLSLQASLLALDQAFVDLRLDPISVPGKSDASPQAVKEIGGNRPIWDFLRAGRLADCRAFAVVGPPASGKTMLLQHVALILAQGRQDRFVSKPYLPVLLPVREHLAAITQENAVPLGQILQDHYGNTTRFPDLHPPQGWFHRQLEHGPALVLLDGIDEVAEIPQRQAVVRWMNRQMETYPGSRFLFTSRPQAYRDSHLDRPVLEVQPLKSDQVRRLIEGFYLANEMDDALRRGAAEDPALRATVSKKAGDLYHKARGMSALGSMLSSPLLLSMLVMVHRRHGGLPPARATLFGELCEELVDCWPKGRRKLTDAHKLAVLAPLAGQMMRRKVRHLSSADVIKIITPLVQPTGLSPEAFLQEVQLSGGLLLEREMGSWKFAHHSLQEFLAAANLADKGEKARWDQMLGDTWWNDTLVLCAALGDASPVISTALHQDTVQALALAAECLEVAHEIDPQVRKAAEDRIIVPLDSDDVKARRTAGEVRLYRRLKSLQRIDDQKEIDLEYLTRAEYQIFLDEMRERGHYNQPDHWTSLRFGKGQALAPVCGVRAEDARDFCVWLSLKQGGSLRYRLPQAEEARTYPAANAGLATWCRDGNIYNLVGLATATEQAIRLQLGKLNLLGMPVSLPLERNLNRELDATVNQAVLHSLDLSVDAVVEKGLFHALDHVRELVLLRALDLGNVISPDLDLARVLARASANHGIATAIDRFNLEEAQRLVEELLTEYDEFEPMARFAALLSDILIAVRAESMQTVQQAQRRYIGRLIEYAYQDYGADESLAPPQRRLKQQGVMEFYAWLQIVIARSEGKLPAWEGIRLVREQAGTGAAQELDLPSWAYNA